MSEYFSKPKNLGANVKVELGLYNYATKADLKNTRGADSSDFAKKADLANVESDVYKLDINKLKNIQSNLSNLKSKVDKLDIRKLEPTPVDLNKLSNIVKNDVVKKTEYGELIKKVNAIQTTDTSALVKKLTKTQKIKKLKKLLTMIMMNILLLTNLIS